jgi:predicted regulator of Ras-like GTPase activity (Roadblock/LC7/MglB family)
MDGHEALADLKQISVQIEAAVIAEHGGAVLACSPDDGPTGELLCRLAREIWEAADASRRDLGRDALTQVELSTAQGSVFVVRDARHVLLATTAPDPTVGLVFYDLKSALHALDGQPGTPAPTSPEPTVVWQADGGTNEGEQADGAA